MDRTRAGPAGEELERAVRLLRLRSRREANGLFAGSGASPFRGAGLEFEESRPYVAGDDPGSFDWHATARTGQLYVKRHRQERSRTLLFALDTSASMGFGSVAASKAAFAARSVALLAAAATRAGDRTALLCFDAAPRTRIAPGRGGAHGLRLLRAAVAGAARPAGESDLAAALLALRGLARRRASVILLSDFRDPSLGGGALARALAELARRHDVIALAVRDPAEIELPRVGLLRVRDPRRPHTTQLLDTSRPGVRTRYAAAAAARERRVDAWLHSARIETRWLRTDESPLHPLARFFAERAARRSAR